MCEIRILQNHIESIFSNSNFFFRFILKWMNDWEILLFYSLSYRFQFIFFIVMNVPFVIILFYLLLVVDFTIKKTIHFEQNFINNSKYWIKTTYDLWKSSLKINENRFKCVYKFSLMANEILNEWTSTVVKGHCKLHFPEVLIIKNFHNGI